MNSHIPYGAAELSFYHAYSEWRTMGPVLGRKMAMKLQRIQAATPEVRKSAGFTLETFFALFCTSLKGYHCRSNVFGFPLRRATRSQTLQPRAGHEG